MKVMVKKQVVVKIMSERVKASPVKFKKEILKKASSSTGDIGKYFSSLLFELDRLHVDMFKRRQMEYKNRDQSKTKSMAQSIKKLQEDCRELSQRELQVIVRGGARLVSY